MIQMQGPLGRLPAPDDRHLQRYSLSAETMPAKPVPVVLGSNWYEAFDRRWEDSRGVHWLVQPGSDPPDWGAIRGGHCFVLKPPALEDTPDWWRKYSQQRNDCVGYGWSRCMSLLNRVFYHAPYVYDEALKRDEWPGEADQGTSVRAGGDVARELGMWPSWGGKITGPKPGHGIEVFRWCRNMQDVAYCLDPDSLGRRILDQGYATMLQSWGTGWPHYVRIPLPALRIILFDQGGDSTIVTDR